VDQWDWEKVIRREERTLDILKEVVRRIHQACRETENFIHGLYPALGRPLLPAEIHFITAQDLEDRWPALSPREREDMICKEKGAVCVMQIGGLLNSGIKHDGRAPDYDDWKLNADIVIWNPILEQTFETSSMGIRVGPEELKVQLQEAGCEERLELTFHSNLAAGRLPYSIGGGIGQSRICMFFLRKAHIGKVQASVWPEAMIEECRAAGVALL
jgi:aspartate--ammonia ligase